MPGTNNEKYITEAWIENGKEEAFKKAYLAQLLDEHEGHGNGFDADTVDKMHYTDILDDIDDATKNLVPSFNIGAIEFNKTNIDSFNEKGKPMRIGFDAVNLNVKNPECNGYQNEEVFYPDFALLPWQEGYDEYNRNWDKIRGCDGPNLLEVFEDLYKKISGRFDEMDGEIEKFSAITRSLSDNVRFLRDENNNIIGSEINAQSINGIRVYIVGKAEYNNLDDAVKNDVHNLFIIKENETGFDDFLKARQPNTAVINKYYEFRTVTRITNLATNEVVDIDLKDGSGSVAEILDTTTDPVKIEKWLQYKHQDLENWQDMCPTADLVEQQNIEPLLIELLENSSGYVLNNTSLLNSLKGIDFRDESDYPLPKYIRNSGIRDAVSTKYKLNTTDPDILPVTQANSGQPRYLQLDNFGDAILKKADITGINSRIQTIQNNYSTLTGSNGRLTTVEERANLNKSVLDELQLSKIPTLENQLSTAMSKIDAINEWKSYTISGLGEDGHTTINYYNEALGLAMLRLHVSSFYKSVPKNTWRSPCKNNSGTVYQYTVVKARPISGGVMIPNYSHSFNTLATIDNLGRIKVKINQDYTGTSSLYHTGTVMYRFDKLYTNEELQKIHTNLNRTKDSSNSFYLIDGKKKDKSGNIVDYASREEFENAYNK